MKSSTADAVHDANIERSTTGVFRKGNLPLIQLKPFERLVKDAATIPHFRTVACTILTAPMLAVALLPRGVNANLLVAGYIGRVLWTIRYLTALPLRVLLMGQQVWSQFPSDNHSRSLQAALEGSS